MDNLISRATYKAIKNMDRVKMSLYLSSLYSKGFEAGQKAGKPTEPDAAKEEGAGVPTEEQGNSEEVGGNDEEANSGAE